MDEKSTKGNEAIFKRRDAVDALVVAARDYEGALHTRTEAQEALKHADAAVGQAEARLKVAKINLEGATQDEHDALCARDHGKKVS